MLAAADSMPAHVTALPLPACGVRGAHLDGEWVFREGEAPPYNMSRSAWPEIWQRPGNTHYYGLCRELLPATTGEHVWTPRGCRLRGFEESAQAGCRLLRGRTITVVGDSTSLQLFQSLTMMLHGTITGWADHGSSTNQLRRTARGDPRHIVSFACEGATRLEFFRNDYLLYSQSDDRGQAKRGTFNPTRPWTDFTFGAHHADVVVLGAGMHFFDGEEATSLYTRVLNHTLASVQRDRRLLHGHQPQTTFFNSPPKPVADCARYIAPISLDDAVVADSNAHQYREQYAQLRQHHSIAEWMSAAHEVSFLDSFSLGGRRPEATMGSSMFRAWQLDPIRTMKAAFHGQELGQVPQKKRARVEKDLAKDCVHFCLPGPTDTYARLFLGMLLDFDDTAPLFAKPAAEGWQAHKRDARLQQRLSVPSMSSLAWWPLK